MRAPDSLRKSLSLISDQFRVDFYSGYIASMVDGGTLTELGRV
jgi:hypothetical protein